MARTDKINEIIIDFISIIFPRLCPGCMTPMVRAEEHLCFTCLGDLPTLRHQGYVNREMVDYLSLRYPIRQGYSLLYYHKASIVGNILKQVKYKGNTDLAIQLGNWLGSVLEFEKLPDLLIPIPLHPAKERRRGYNQSEKLARGISDSTGIFLCANFLERTRDTFTQTRKSRVDRLLNVQDIFRPQPTIDLKGKTVILVDDVYTTGATIEAALSPLLSAGVEEVIPVTLATGK